jgi:hypothetical protein
MKLKFMMFIALTLALWPDLCQAETLGSDMITLAKENLVMPLGRVLLVNRGEWIEAVIFTVNEDKPDGIHSKYEYFEYELSGFRKIREGDVIYRKIEESWWNYFKYNLLGIHPNPYNFADHLAFKGFQLFISPGYRHTSVHFWNKAHVVDYQVRLAPTPWKSIEKVNLSDPRIRWFGYDEK